MSKMRIEKCNIFDLVLYGDRLMFIVSRNMPRRHMNAIDLSDIEKGIQSIDYSSMVTRGRLESWKMEFSDESTAMGIANKPGVAFDKRNIPSPSKAVILDLPPAKSGISQLTESDIALLTKTIVRGMIDRLEESIN